jgi:hypothetical protein
MTQTSSFSACPLAGIIRATVFPLGYMNAHKLGGVFQAEDGMR